MPIKLTSNSIVSILDQRVNKHPEKHAFRYFTNLEDQPSVLTFQQLDEKAKAIATVLQQFNAQGERALLIYPTSLEFITAFMGCLYAGVIAIPVCPPSRNQSAQNIGNIVADATPLLALTTSDYSYLSQDFVNLFRNQLSLSWVTTDNIETAQGNYWKERRIDDNEIAYLQYTSGSTSNPRGVKISHGNIIANSILIEKCFGSHSETIGLSWLPHYHDMGLVGKILEPIYTGCQVVFTSPRTFMKHPLLWLKAISHFKATISGAPNYAYDLCATIAKNKGLNGLNLSSWEVAINGSEPVKANTIRRFSEAYAPFGFNPKAFCPSYGLAESTLLVSGIKKDEHPKIESFDAENLADAKISAPINGKPAKELVSCGLVDSHYEIVIVFPDSKIPCRSDEIGEIWLAGPSIAKGYWDTGKINCNSFNSYLPAYGKSRYFRTGDLGFIKDGHLFITGRKKDLIIIGGQNFYPQDLEAIAGKSHPAIRSHSCVAFQSDQNGRSGIILVTEVKATYKKEDYTQITSAIRSSLLDHQNVSLDKILLVKKGTLPKTVSGKIQRFLCKKYFCDGKLEILEMGSPESTFQTKSNKRSITDKENLVSKEIDELKRLITNKIVNILGIPPEALKTNETLYDLGLSSLRALELSLEIEELYGIKLSQKISMQEMTIDQLIQVIREQPAVDENEATTTKGKNKIPLMRVKKSNGKIDANSRFDPAFSTGNLLEIAKNFPLFDQLRESDQMPFFQALDSNEGTTCIYQGKRTIMLGSNNYLGLSADQRVREAASRAALEYGPSMTGSRLLNGSTVRHEALERKLADFLGYEAALVFTTGYQANLGLISALMNKESYLILDDDCHASIYDGAFLSRCHIKEFRHNDINDLEKKLLELPSKCSRLVIVDGVYSMRGDIALLPEIDRVCKKWNTPYVVDEAHALGVLGKTGRGTQEHYNLQNKADLLTGTFSKSLASIGGWVAGEAKVIDWIRFNARPMLFSASLPPSSVAAASAALDVLKSEPWRIKKVEKNAQYFKQELIKAGFDVCNSQTPIIAIRLGNDLTCVQFTKKLLEEGVFVNACVYPAVQRNSALIRTSVIATHEKDLLDKALAILAKVGKQMGIIA